MNIKLNNLKEIFYIFSVIYLPLSICFCLLASGKEKVPLILFFTLYPVLILCIIILIIHYIFSVIRGKKIDILPKHKFIPKIALIMAVILLVLQLINPLVNSLVKVVSSEKLCKLSLSTTFFNYYFAPGSLFYNSYPEKCIWNVCIFILVCGSCLVCKSAWPYRRTIL